MGETFEDQYGEFDEDAGLKEPEEGRCNAKLKNWQGRYGEPRYCGNSPKGCPPPKAPNAKPEEAEGFCRHHQYKKTYRMRAKELLQHGAYTESREHLYDKVDSWDKLLMHGIHESLMEDSIHDFAPEYKEKIFDFTEEDAPDSAPRNDDGNVIVEVAYPTEQLDRGKALWCAAVDSVKAENVNAKIAEDMMEVEHTSHAQLTSPTETNPNQVWKELTEKREHHLNLAYSRLIQDREKLLSYGGIVTGTKADVEDNSQVIDEFAMVEPDPEAVEGEGSGMMDIDETEINEEQY